MVRAELMKILMGPLSPPFGANESVGHRVHEPQSPPYAKYMRGHRVWGHRVRSPNLWLCLIFENKTNAGPSDNVFQLAKAHSLHTLFAVLGKKQNFQKICGIW
jgi:hypothetical protein